MKTTHNFDLYWTIEDSVKFNRCLGIVDQWANNGINSNVDLTVKEIVSLQDPKLYDQLSPEDKRLLGRAVSNRYSIKYYNHVKKTGKKGLQRPTVSSKSRRMCQSVHPAFFVCRELHCNASTLCAFCKSSA